MKVEKVIFRPSVEHATPRGVCDFLAEVFANLDERPRRVEVEIDFSEAFADELVVVCLEKGEPVFQQRGREAAYGKFRGRWLAEHAVPLVLSAHVSRMALMPADHGRIRVRTRSRFGAIAAAWAANLSGRRIA